MVFSSPLQGLVVQWEIKLCLDLNWKQRLEVTPMITHYNHYLILWNSVLIWVCVHHSLWIECEPFLASVLAFFKYIVNVQNINPICPLGELVQHKVFIYNDGFVYQNERVNDEGCHLYTWRNLTKNYSMKDNWTP